MDLGVDDEVFRPDPDDRAETRTRLGLSSEKRVLLYVGRLGPEKNVHTLFQSFQILHQESPGIYELLCLGDGTQRAALEELRVRVDGVHWHPFFSDPHELASAYRCADLFVHPGVQETFGLVALESQACGTPVVGIRGSYMDRIIFSDQSDWASENSSLALAAAIQKKFQSQSSLDGSVVSRMARSRYAWRAVFGRLFSAYEEVIDRYSP
jgi:alpha-1,6-mannosyltransferase